MKGYFIGWVFVIALCMAIIHNNPVSADTNVSGYISADTTWTSANSPYVATGNIVVKSGVTLTIESGVTVKVDSGKSIQMDGTLIAKGTSASKITFTKNSSSNWGYILFSDSSTDAAYDTAGNYTSGSILEYCLVEYAGGTSISNNGAVRMDNAHPFINYCTTKNNSASGIYAWNFSGTLKIKNNTISNNTASSNGGGICAVASSIGGDTATISGNTISNNTSSSSGGGIYSSSFSATISGNTISNNTSSSSGGGICASGSWSNSQTTISGNTISNNTSLSSGGGIYNSSEGTISGNTISNNTSSSSGGGGIYATGLLGSKSATISSNTINNNTASSSGGGIYARDIVAISGNTISNNTASSWGGGIYIFWQSTSVGKVTKNSLTRNSAKNASAVYYKNGNNRDFTYNTIMGNKATDSSNTYTVYISSNPTFNYNNIFSNTATYELWNGNSYGSSNLDAKNNWWGTTDDSAVQGKIYDWIDDSTKGTVDYATFETAIRTDCPISPPTGFTATAGSGQITLGWSANSESDTAGYKVYWDTDSGHSYANSADVGNVTGYTITGLADSKYYVTVTAYDTTYSSASDDTGTVVNENQTSGNESWYAEEKTVTVGSGATTPTPSPTPTPTPSDTTAPSGSVSINIGASYTNSTTVTLTLSATDSVGVTGYYVSDSSTTPSTSASGWTSVTSTTSYSGSVSYSLSSGEGSKTIYVWYKDAAGNVSSTASATITLDTTVPTVTISSPTSSSTYTATSSTITLSGSASDSTSGISEVSWSNSKGGSGTASGTASWTISGISLSSGDNVITVTATDGAGNKETDTITVTYTAPSPSPTPSPMPTVTATPPETECYQFVTKWGSYGTGDGQFNKPSGLAVDSSGNIYVVDYGNYRVQKFSSSGTFITKWGSKGTGDGQFNLPVGVAVDASGNVYVADQSNNRIQKFTSSGTFITKWGSYGTGDGQFNSTWGVAIDSSGNVYATDNYNHRIQKFSSSGTFITKWGSYGSGDGQYNVPTGVSVYSGNIYVADQYNHRIQKLDFSGAFITKWGSYGTGDNQFNYPAGIAVDAAGYVYAAGGYNNYTQKFSSSGTFITKWGSGGTGNGQFNSQVGIAVDALGNVYIADHNNHRIQKFSLSPCEAITPTPTPTATATPVASPTPQVSPSPSNEGIVFGIVNDLDDNALKGVTVTITGTDYSDSTSTDEYGYYQFTGLSAGDYTMTYEKEGFLDQTQEISLKKGDVRELETITMEEVIEGKIYGYVVDTRGDPIESVRLKLKGLKTKVKKTTASDADGFFEFADLGVDTYVIFANKKRYKKMKVTVKLEEGENKDIEIEMKRTSKRIKGLMLEEDVQ